MGARYSDEQWKDLKMKIQLGIVALIVGTAIFFVGPGLGKIVNYAKKNKDKPWAAKWLYNCGRLMEMTWRDDKALELYENDFYLLYCGDESQIDWTEVQKEMAQAQGHPEKLSDSDRFFLPWIAAKYTPETRPAWVGGEGAKPHPLLEAVLYRVLKFYENHRDSLRVQHIYKACLRPPGIFPADAESHQRMIDAERRAVMRGS